jgi:hypothetical protein
MVLAGEYTKCPEETCCTAIFSFTNNKRTGLRSKLGLRGKRPATDTLRFRPVVTVWIEIERKKK